MKLYKCDKCGKIIRDPSRLQIEGKQNDPVMIVLQKMDMCKMCYEGIYSLLDDYVSHKA